MSELRNISYRLLPCTVGKAKSLARLAGACRYVWNQMLDYQDNVHTACALHGCQTPSPTRFTLYVAFTRLRKATPWLQELPCAPVRHTLKYQADAWQAYFKRQRGRPKFKGRRGDDSVTLPDQVRIHEGRLYVPKLGWYVLRRRGGNPYPTGLPKQAVIRQALGKWYCTVCYEVDIERREDDGLAIGVDRNIRQLATSTGDIIPLPDTSRLEARRKRYQRTVARRTKGSNRRKRAVQLAAKTSRAIAQVRKDWCHQTSRMLANSASEIVLENLNTKGMTASAKGTAEAPGSNVKQKAGLNKGILESSWSQMERAIGYKALVTTKVPPPYTSQTCNSCGLIDIANRKTQSDFRCVGCGHQSNADVNAALNILALGTRASGRGGALTLVTPSSRQKMCEPACA